jgi:hypothetical protein
MATLISGGLTSPNKSLEMGFKEKLKWTPGW